MTDYDYNCENRVLAATEIENISVRVELRKHDGRYYTITYFRGEVFKHGEPQNGFTLASQEYCDTVKKYIADDIRMIPEELVEVPPAK